MGNSQGKAVVLSDEVNLNHFRLLRVVGKGAFGKVRIVERKDSGHTFALKYIRKDEIVRQESVRNIIRERRMLEHLNHPFLCNLRYSFQDMEYLYLVVDLMSGGDLRFHISRKSFTEECIRFWMAELACALRYIHRQGIVHRDVKPDNVLLDSDGHVHLADFNVASDFRPSKLLTSKSGTLAYLAPEAFKGTGYLCEVDWWSLGVTFYECIYGKRPFEGKHQEELSDAICAANPRFWTTKPVVSNPCLHAMSSLMERDKKKRIGAAGWETFTDNPFFRPIDFEALERKHIPPVFIPSSEKTNFDATYDLEELLLEEAPLEARARKQKPRAELKQDATSREIREDELYRMIETMFEPFDYTHARYEGRAGDAVAGNVPEEHVELKITATQVSSSAKTSPSSSVEGESAPPSPGLTPVRSHPHQGFDQDDHRSAPLSTVRSQPRTHSRSHSRSQSHQLQENQQYALGPSKSRDVSQQQTAQTSFSRPLLSSRPAPLNRQTSRGATSGPDDGVTWSGLPDQSAAPAQDIGERFKESSSSVLGFLGRKKGRDRSPKPKEPGVLGKIGSRHIVG